MSDKAQRQTILIGPIEVEGFMMPDGSYRMSQTQSAEAIEKSEITARRFLDSKGIKSLLGKAFRPDTIQIEKPENRGAFEFNAIPLEVVSAFWLWEASKGNKKAIALCYALMTETLERRFDSAFGVERSEADYNQLLTARLQKTEQQLALLSDAYAEPDILRERVSRLEDEIKRLDGQIDI
jgi:hypothetical protein